ncbi:MAG: isoaspartyl peptidase/L-asparaginase [Bdellovibrionales bacterium]|nr:isoaspartyl peptidase/L-asparaginase [Bdellovibrionales bacterium]
MAVILHGGAGHYDTSLTKNKLPGLRAALEAAWSFLTSGKPAEFAVAAALKVMEGDQYFNAGFGGYPNINGIVLLDVGLMRGTRDFISLINVRRVKFPSAIALDMLKHKQTLLSIWTHEHMQQLDQSPEIFKERYGWVSTHDELIAPVVEQMVKRKKFEVDNKLPGGTIGCVVRDANGRLAAGTSTGGVSLKHNGRIGDTPIIGAGVFADDEVCALSTTGHGESFLMSSYSGFVVAEIRSRLRSNPDFFNQNPEELRLIMEAELSELERKAPGHGGIVLIPSKGAPAYALNSEMLSLAYRTGSPDNITSDKAAIVLRDGSLLD